MEIKMECRHRHWILSLDYEDRIIQFRCRSCNKNGDADYLEFLLDQQDGDPYELLPHEEQY
jgi:hypothetical protein